MRQFIAVLLILALAAPLLAQEAPKEQAAPTLDTRMEAALAGQAVKIAKLEKQVKGLESRTNDLHVAGIVTSGTVCALSIIVARQSSNKKPATFCAGISGLITVITILGLF